MIRKSLMYIDGSYVKVDPKILDAFTPGIFQGQGVFETMLAIGDLVFDAKLHLKRLKAAFPKAKVSENIIHKIVKTNGFEISRVRVLAWKEGRDRHVAVMALPYLLPQKVEYKVCVIQTNRMATARLANIKSLDYALFAQAYQKAIQAGFDEALLLNKKGQVFEASRSNVFWVSQGRLYTPPLSSGCLKGITRSQIIQKAKQLKVSVSERNLSLKELMKADQVFLTNSLIGLMPVAKRSFQHPHRIS